MGGDEARPAPEGTRRRTRRRDEPGAGTGRDPKGDRKAGGEPRRTGGYAGPGRAGSERRPRDAEEGSLRGLSGGGPSRVGVVGAMRARDVSRPDQHDLDAALERDRQGLSMRADGRAVPPRGPQPSAGSAGSSPVSS